MEGINREDIEEFLKEGQDYFDEVEPLLIELLEGASSDQEDDIINTAFRIFHSIKGVSGFLSLNNIQNVTHGVESILDQIRSGKMKLNQEILKEIFSSLDLIKKLFSKVDLENNDQGYEENVQQIIQRLHDISDSYQEHSAHLPDFDSNFNELFECFNTPGFFSEFKTHYFQSLDEIEVTLLGLLDTQTEYSEIYTKVINDLNRLNFNCRIYSFTFPDAVIKVLIDDFNISSEKNLFKQENLSDYYSLFGMLKNFAFDDTLHKSDLETLQSISEKLKSSFEIVPEINLSEVVEVQKASKVSNDTSKSSRNNLEIRVSLDKIDKLVELIEELGVVSGVVATDIESSNFNIHTFNQTQNKLTQITSSLQDVAMSVRLVPLGPTFKKMGRLVFDVSNKLSKSVNLKIFGENVEIDKNMVESIQDPLVHIFRNAIDHGIESPQDRLDSGKKESGLIELKAWHAGGEVHISIQDDGKGMDPEFIKQKAIDKGVVTLEEAQKIKSQDAYNLVMAPGFSTAEVVTDFSGRGVGMDVVKKSIEKLNGSISIDSTLGEGTTFHISFPLTSTIVEGMLVKVGDLKYTIRIASIRESFKGKSDQLINTPGGQEKVRIRDEIYPIYRLSQLNKTNNYLTDIEDGILVLVESKDKSVVLFVDDIIGTTQSVIKALPKYFGRLKGVSGCSVIGTGSADISWTVDVTSLTN